MSAWSEYFIKTWFAWPQFDQRDHAFCPVLDQANAQEDPIDFSAHTEHLPYTDAARIGGETQRSYVTPWQFMSPTAGHIAEASRSISLTPWRLSDQSDQRTDS